ncbi:MAG: polysaccharide deacetylase family protein [Micavibrio sp.]|nr:polysaccharide deacetylase family protein [Micavibrio sp.]
MARKALLTIDDSPSTETEKLVDYLADNNIPAILFVRGALMEKNPCAIEYAIKRGIIIGNHSFAHKPAGEMEPQEWADDLELCEHLIEAAYRRCDIEREAKYYRFPYIDRGDGQKVEQIDKATLSENDKTQTLQDYLHEQHFYQPFRKMPRTYPKRAYDCLYTYTARDWMLNDKHRGKQPIKSREDLIARAASDPSLQNELHPHILLLHDQDGMVDDAIALIEWFRVEGFEFLDFG